MNRLHWPGQSGISHVPLASQQALTQIMSLLHNTALQFHKKAADLKIKGGRFFSGLNFLKVKLIAFND